MDALPEKYSQGNFFPKAMESTSEVLVYRDDGKTAVTGLHGDDGTSSNRSHIVAFTFQIEDATIKLVLSR